MPEIIISKGPLENAMKLACLSTEASENTITGHCLFEVAGQVLKILATDNRNRLSMSKIGISSEIEMSFTADPRKILKLIKTAESDTLKMEFISESNTLQIFLSDSKESYVSLPSFDPKSYAPITESFEKAYDLKTVNAGVFLGGMHFIKGLLDQKDQKFSNMYITNGVIYGSNGNNKAGAFSSPDLKDLDELVFPISTFPAIASLIETLDLREVLISTSSNSVFISSPGKDSIYGFTKVQIKMPKIPINVDEPDFGGWTIDKSSFLKKLSRLQLSGDSKMGIRCEFLGDKINFSTLADRSSKDSMFCKPLKDPVDTTCLTECRLLENALSQFGGNEIDFYVKNKITLFKKGELEYEVGGVKATQPFISAAAVSLSREE
jgi:hypothetical protein